MATQVKPSNARTLLLAGFPSPILAGVAGNFTITARDAFGNLATGYTGTVQFSSSDSQATLPANYTFNGGDKGVHSFSASLGTAGRQTVAVLDYASGWLTSRRFTADDPDRGHDRRLRRA